MMEQVNPNMAALADAFEALTYREMKECAEVFSEALEAQNGLCVKPEVFSEVLDGFGSFLAIEGELTDGE